MIDTLLVRMEQWLFEPPESLVDKPLPLKLVRILRHVYALCRDFLRSHPVAAQAYAQVKQQLALRFPDDEDAYYDIKDPVFDIIVEGAEEWALRTNWIQPPGD